MGPKAIIYLEISLIGNKLINKSMIFDFTGEFHQHHQQRQQQQTPEWFGSMQGNNQTQFYANDLTMTNQSSTQMQRVEIQSMNFTNFQVTSLTLRNR